MSILSELDFVASIYRTREKYLATHDARTHNTHTERERERGGRGRNRHDVSFIDMQSDMQLISRLTYETQTA